MPSPTRIVLSSMREHGVRYLLMGGQACILYGAAEFSRDTDIAVLAEPENLERLRGALTGLQAHVLAVPPFEAQYLERGHAVHFECGPASAAPGMRVDVMASMRNVPPFAECWTRRSTYELDDLGPVEVLGLEDLVNCKKTRRDKDWPMIRRLVERHYLDPALEPTPERFGFWLRELRTPVLLTECVARARGGPAELVAALRDATATREAVARAAAGDSEAGIASALETEERRERAADEAYWQPRIRELEALRHALRRARSASTEDDVSDATVDRIDDPRHQPPQRPKGRGR